MSRPVAIVCSGRCPASRTREAPHAPIALTADGRLLFAARALRSFSFGWLSVILALYLAGRGLSATAIGAVFTATMVEDALLTMALSTLAGRVGAARLMAMTAPLIALGGFLLATAESPWLLVVGAVLGTLSPNGQDAGPFSPLEHSLLPGALRAGPAVRGVRLVQPGSVRLRGGGRRLRRPGPGRGRSGPGCPSSRPSARCCWRTLSRAWC